jgi:general stress protein 26
MRRASLLNHNRNVRVERSFHTAQDRWVKELRLAKASTCEQANEVPQRLLPGRKRRFAQAAPDSRDAHRGLEGAFDLAAILSIQEQRVDIPLVVRHGARGLAEPPPAGYAGGRVTQPSPRDPPMTKPTPQPISPAEVRDRALAVVKADRFPYLATIDGDQPRLRPVSPVRTDGFTVYVANLRAYHKTAEIEANPKVELGYLDEHHDQVRITGVAEVVADRALLQEIWDANPLLHQHLGSLDNPQLIVYRVRPTRVRYMQEWALEYINVPLDSAENSAASPTKG